MGAINTCQPLYFRCQRLVRTSVAKGFNRFHGKLFDRSQSTSHGPQKPEISFSEVKVRAPKRSSTLSGKHYHYIIIILRVYYRQLYCGQSGHINYCLT